MGIIENLMGLLNINDILGKYIFLFVIVTICCGLLFEIIRRVPKSFFVEFNEEVIQRKATESICVANRKHIVKLTELFLLVVIFILEMYFGCLHPEELDKVLLLEEKQPSYFRWLGRAETILVEPEEGTGDVVNSYVLTKASKDGFGSITYNDFQFYMKTVLHIYPQAAWTTICFTDGTGIEIRDNSLSNAIYGTLGSNGRVNAGDEVNLTSSLQNQIEGITTIQYEYDEHKNPIHELHLDAEGNAVADADGIAEYYREYDNRKHIVWEKRLGIDGKPVLDASGTAEFRMQYDGDNLIKESFFDGNGNPVCNTDMLYASVSYEYDNMHHITLEQYYDEKGKRILSDSGCASIRRTYEGDNLISECFFGTDDEPILSSNGYASRVRSYDRNNNVNYEIYRGEDGEPLLTPNGYASFTCTYDEKGHVLYQEFYGIDGKRILLSSGYSAFERSYDVKGRLISEKYLSTDDSPIDCTKGYASVESDYDDDNNLVEQRYYDVDGKLTISSYGYAKVKRDYKEGHVVTESYFGENGKPLKMAAGYYAISQKWDGDTLIERIYLDNAGKAVERMDGYSKAVWVPADNKWIIYFRDLNDVDIPIEGLNLVKDVEFGSDGWSEWMSPENNVANCCFGIGTMNLGENVEGDTYTCSLEIEFKNVAATEGQEFGFWTQGAQDDGWTTGNVWNGNLISLFESPTDGVYTYTYSHNVSADMTKISTFRLGFRCDNWKTGSFRVRNVKVEKADKPSIWSPGV